MSFPRFDRGTVGMTKDIVNNGGNQARGPWGTPYTNCDSPISLKLNHKVKWGRQAGLAQRHSIQILKNKIF